LKSEIRTIYRSYHTWLPAFIIVMLRIAEDAGKAKLLMLVEGR
jgi:hypothetical protein